MSEKPADVQAYEEAMQRLREGRILEAIKLFEEAATTGEDRPMEHYALGCAYVKVGQLADARRELTRFLDMEKATTPFVTAAREALASLEKKLKEEPGEPPPERRLDAVRLRFQAAMDHLDQGAYDRAREVLEALAEDLPKSEEVQNLLGFVHLRSGRYQEAVRCFEKALKLNPVYAYAENNLGLALFRGGAAAALRHFERAIERDPDCFEAYLNAGIVLDQLGETERAKEAWRRAAAIDPNDPVVKRYLRYAEG